MTQTTGAASATASAGTTGVATASTATAAGATAALPGLGANGPRVMREQLGDEVRSPAGSASAPGAKLGRNDPCYCGSGLKYKKCHGR